MKQGGFTLVELMIAMAVFSSMLLIVAVGFINVVKVYQSGLASRNAQQNGRFGMEQVAREAREAYDAQILSVTPTLDVLCLTSASGMAQYYVSGDRLYRATIGNAVPVCNVGLLNSTAVTSGDVSVMRFKMNQYQTPPATNPKSLQIELGISSTNDPTRLNGTMTACNPAVSGANFCSVMNMRSSVTLRGTP